MVEKCDFCEKQALYDGNTVYGKWAFMCEADFQTKGLGLGLGRGQKLKVEDENGEEKCN